MDTADDCAVYTGTFVRFGAQGGEIGLFGFTCVMCLHATSALTGQANLQAPGRSPR